MKIRNISCTQFAGVRDRNVAFTDGINVIYGQNESGKSTLVNLLSHTLFQKVRLDGRNENDKIFRSLYFPSSKKGGAPIGDFIDGKVSFEGESGTYTISKEWGAEPRCTLSTPDGVIRDQVTIADIMKREMLYGEGVYSDMLFSSQRSTSISLQTILDAAQKTEAKQEIMNAVNKAFVESDGVSVDAIEGAINKKIEDISGKHWDADRGMPERKAGRWANGLGEILKAYYDLEDAKKVLEDISRLEFDVDRVVESYAAAEAAVVIAESEYNKFNAVSSVFAIQTERIKAVARLESDIKKISSLLEDWPKLESDLSRANLLKTEKENREILDKYEAAKAIKDELDSIDASAILLECPTNAEIMQVKIAQKNIAVLENKLCGMNLNAVVKMFGENYLEITSLRSGERIELNDDTAEITEAVKLTVPGIMEMQLAPANVDVATVELQISEQKQVVESVLEKYGADSVEQLEEYARKITTDKARAENAQNRLNFVLGTMKYEDLENAALAILASPRSKTEIERDIILLCGSGDVNRFVTSKETVLTGYEMEYRGISELKAKAYDLEQELRKTKESLASVEDIPEEYVSVSDPEAYLDMLKREYKFKQQMRDMAFEAKSAASSKLEAYKETLKGDPAAEVEKAERIFAEKKELLDHWRHIYEVFKAQKETIADNPTQIIAERFASNLDIISGGKITSEFPEADKLKMNVYSDNNLLDYGKLSEGTKDTVSLAFRLAVLDHLFPDGGGVIVLDDPFTDMDAQRTADACRLLEDAATRHQIIFLTCKEEYLDILKGNKILF